MIMYRSRNRSGGQFAREYYRGRRRLKDGILHRGSNQFNNAGFYILMQAIQQSGELLVVGSINMDLVFQTSQLPSPGETVIGGSFCQINGGKGANQAVAAARGSNVQVKLLAAIGGDGYATSIMESFKLESRLSVALIQQVAHAATGVAAIMVDDHGENMICVAGGANERLSCETVEAVANQG